jgi:hypothetical protein
MRSISREAQNQTKRKSAALSEFAAVFSMMSIPPWTQGSTKVMTVCAVVVANNLLELPLVRRNPGVHLAAAGVKASEPMALTHDGQRLILFR